MNTRLWLCLVLLGAVAPARAQDTNRPSPFHKDNLVAWCIVPFDAQQRGPDARAEMVSRLGLKRVAYDWRKQHVPSFEQEILAYKKHGIEYFAFWGWHPSMATLIKKHGIRPQIWKTCPSPPIKGTEAQKVEFAAHALMPLIKQTQALGLKLGLYNHGGWGGEPKNLVAVVRHLRKTADANHVGIIYNFHHGHGHIKDFATSFKAMQPYLWCLNINGMNDGAKPKILPVGQGKHELAMLKAVAAAGYRGPVGILDHVNSSDSEVQLRLNLEGLKKCLGAMGDAEALKSFN